MTEAEPGPSTSPVFRLVYRSRSAIPAEERRAGLADVFDVARSNNRRSGVTGALLVTDHYFVQTLEGDEERVRALYDRIAADPRHTDVTVVSESVPGVRVFSKWAMARVSADGSGDIPLHTSEGRISPAAPSPVTPEQAALLRTMRNTIGADVV